MAPGRISIPLSLKALVIGCLASALAAVAWRQWLRVDTADRIAREAGGFETRLSARIEAYLALLRGATGLFAVNPDVSRDDFRLYVDGMALAQNYPGVQGIGFTLRVEADQLDKVEALARLSGWPDFAVWPRDRRSEYHTILYLEPQDERNRAAIGYDMHTEPARRVAMDRARDSGQPAASGKVTLVQEIDERKQPGFLIYMPFYRGAPLATPEERRARLIGFVYAPFRVGDFIRAISRHGSAEQIDVAIYDGAKRTEQDLLFQFSQLGDEPRRRAQTETRTLRVADRTWTLVYSAAVTEVLPPIAVFCIGLLISAGASVLLRRESRARTRAEQSEAETREREGELALLIESVPALVAFIDRDGVVRLCNRRYQDWFGLPPDSVVGRRIAEVVGPHSYAALAPAVARAMQGEALMDERWFKAPGGARYLATYFVPHRTRSGQLNGFYALTSDLTAHKRAEEGAHFVADCGKLLISSLDHETTARAVVHVAVPRVADVAVLFRRDGDGLRVVAIAHANQAVQNRLEELTRDLRLPLGGINNIAAAARSGLVVVANAVDTARLLQTITDPRQQEILRGLDLVSALHIPVVVRGGIWAVLSLGTAAESGRRFTDHDRQLAEEISTRVRLAVENSLLYEEAQQEIEERARAERAARESEERFRLLVEGARDYAIVLLDPDGKIASWNAGAERILGFSEREAVGRPAALLFETDDEPGATAEKRLAVARESGSTPEERWYGRKDGSRFWGSGHTVALRNEHGQIRAYAKILRDLTGWKMTEEELERRVQERTNALNEAVQELEAFSYSVSHDLRSPLRSIRGFTELALEEAGPRLTAEERGYLARVQRAVTRLDQLISDLLAYTRVSKTKVDLVPVDLHTLVTDIRREHPEFQPPRADIRIEGRLLPVMGNVAYLTQCVTNLLGNAVKFVRAGEAAEVHVWTERVGPLVRMSVRDRGIGIPKENLHRVFEMFERLHVSAGYEGTGVGLAIVRRAVQRMKGTVGVASDRGEGATFWFELPAVEAAAAGGIGAASRPGEPSRP